MDDVSRTADNDKGRSPAAVSLEDGTREIRWKANHCNPLRLVRVSIQAIAKGVAGLLGDCPVPCSEFHCWSGCHSRDVKKPLHVVLGSGLMILCAVAFARVGRSPFRTSLGNEHSVHRATFSKDDFVGGTRFQVNPERYHDLLNDVSASASYSVF